MVCVLRTGGACRNLPEAGKDKEALEALKLKYEAERDEGYDGLSVDTLIELGEACKKLGMDDDALNAFKLHNEGLASTRGADDPETLKALETYREFRQSLGRADG